MTPAQIQAWIQVTGLLVNTGIATFTQVRNVIKSFNKGLTEEEMDAIIQGVILNSEKRKALADAEANAPVKP